MVLGMADTGKSCNAKTRRRQAARGRPDLSALCSIERQLDPFFKEEIGADSRPLPRFSSKRMEPAHAGCYLFLCSIERQLDPFSKEEDWSGLTPAATGNREN